MVFVCKTSAKDAGGDLVKKASQKESRHRGGAVGILAGEGSKLGRSRRNIGFGLTCKSSHYFFWSLNNRLVFICSACVSIRSPGLHFREKRVKKNYQSLALELR
jgi:hypothetical protein